ncbi:ABC transporter ATP-binding protein [Paenibacillus athensensis]|uniref:ABC transporter ATP-binding protein n=1 Tax=Paenibacillus athensensis TaxID=1967502 RepID=UPI001E54E12B|nr:ABC transporter ATP-binding protein [Paenibacillus athensensis]
MSKLELNGIEMGFAGATQTVNVLGGVTLHVDEGEFVSLIGPSGSGKSTLFHLIGGLYEPDAGEVRLDGQRINGRRGLVGYMPQQPALLPWRSVEANALLAREVAGPVTVKDKALAREWLAKAGLGGFEREYPHALSGGMQQRVSFVRAMLGPHRLLCLDEPFGALDALTRTQMQSWLLDLWETSKRAVLLVTHSIDEALYMSDRIYVLSDKPAKVLREIVVPFARPRREDVLSDPAFGRLRSELYALLRKEEISHASH